MRWRHRKRLLAALQVTFALALVPTFAVMAWSVGDGPAALAALGFGSPLPPLDLTNAFMAVPTVSLFLAMSRVARMVDSMRMLAIDGGTQIIPPARSPAPVDLTAFMLPVTLVWRPTRR
ncbi:MAG: hypothetical protein KGO05_16625, partial [Chloroflexota bacterium]|nr:hypothetical protein [Chloroflexota bacterium]